MNVQRIVQQEAWMGEGNCAGMATDVFFPSIGDKRAAAAAKEVCKTCPVVADCLDYALRLGIKQGIWGATTPGDRRRIRRKDQVREMFQPE